MAPRNSWRWEEGGAHSFVACLLHYGSILTIDHATPPKRSAAASTPVPQIPPTFGLSILFLHMRVLVRIYGTAGQVRIFSLC